MEHFGILEVNKGTMKIFIQSREQPLKDNHLPNFPYLNLEKKKQK